MNLYEKLLLLQKEVTAITKDGENKNDKYNYVSGEAVLNVIRPKMDELGLLLAPAVRQTALHEGTTRSGTSRFMTEIWYDFTWVDVESCDTLTYPWYAQGVDLAGERGVGKAATYAEKTFLLKFFHVPTDKDDPDNDGRRRDGEQRQSRSAKRETAEFHRTATTQMLNELYAGDSEKIKSAIVALTKSDSRGYAGVDSIDALTDKALPVIYAKVKRTYETRKGHAFELKEDSADAAV
jgi:hypothetical protein